MVRIVEEYRAERYEVLSELLLELRVRAFAQCPGQITSEILASKENGSTMVLLSTWESFQDWEQWATSEMRASLHQQIEPLLLEQPKVRAFYIEATEHQTETQHA